jgi:hypothetical protein
VRAPENGPALALARDLCSKLLERRALGPGQLEEALRAFGEKGRAILADSREAFPALRLAGEITGRLIERGRLSSVSAALESLGQNARAVKEAAASLPPEKAGPAIKAAQDLVLKLLETNAISPGAVKDSLRELSRAAASIL